MVHTTLHLPRKALKLLEELARVEYHNGHHFDPAPWWIAPPTFGSGFWQGQAETNIHPNSLLNN